MANTLFDHGAEYHFHDINFTRNHATMRQTEHDRTKPSKLELLQEDYRSKLLHEREQKANALFEQKVRAELLPKKGSVRDFFLNRRMLAASTSGASSGVNLPPIKTNRRYKGKQKDKTKLVEKQLVDKGKEKVEAIAFLNDMEKTQDVSELGKLRQKHRKSKTESQQDVPAVNMADNSLSQSFSSTCDKKGVNKDVKNTSLRKARGVKSREIYKRSGKPSDETNNDRNTNINSQELESSFTEHKITRARRGVKSQKIYKRGRKRPEESNREKSTNTKPNTNANSEDRASSFVENDAVSKSLVKIKELVNRRKTEEIILRSKTAKLTTEMATPSPRRNSQSFDEMCKVEMELRETISREQKKLLALQERRRQKITEYGNEMESHKKIGGKERQTAERKQNALGQSREKKTTKNMKKSEQESRQEKYMEQTPLNSKKTKQNNQCETMDTNSVSNENANQQQQTNKTQTRKVQNNSSSVNAMIELVTCSNCGRGFMKERIAKHEKACRKASARIKKPFDAKRKRAEGTDMEKYIIMGKDTSDDSACKV
ncbi:Hypothetical predicted protein [Paramuricea clavata]|uniref:C2HC/C3H-type domain-containing protein n=1 Tax=Paramuricea clavata TaxID=317549 RepID=A0A7D9HPP3_PARCT|nr:Hypothetical predicted protein [Paramuricea clavata]